MNATEPYYSDEDIEAYAFDDIEYQCGCPYCHCADPTPDGGACDSCLEGAHKDGMAERILDVVIGSQRFSVKLDTKKGDHT